MLARNIHDEDTIEMQLSAADLEALTRAAEEAEEAQAAEAAARAPAPSTAAVSIVAPPPTGAAALAAPPPAVAERMASAFAAPAPERTPPRPTMTTTARAPASPAHAPAWPATIAPTPVPKATPPIVVELVPLVVQPVSPKPVVAVAAPPAARPLEAAPRPRPMSALGFRVAAAAVVAIAVVLAILYWPSGGAPDPAAHPKPAGPATITAPVTEPVPQPAPEPRATELANGEPPPVRFANPFDASEVFEFPAGTSYVEARDQVAQVLLARARERGDRNTLSPPARKTTATTRPDTPNNKASLARRL